MAIKMRRGLIADLDRSKLVAGEIVMSTDTGFVGIAKAPNDVMELAKKDDIPDEVIANPSGTATDDLTKIQIGQTIYDVEGGSGEVVEMTYAQYQALTPQQKMDGTVRYVSDYPSGGSGSGDGYSETVLFTSNVLVTDMVLSDSFNNYDAICIIDIQSSQASSGEWLVCPVIYPSSLLNSYIGSSRSFMTSYSGSGYFWSFNVISDTLLRATDFGYKYRQPIKVLGLKFGGGSLPDYSTTEQDTGRKWIDGRTVYSRVGVFPSNTNVSGTWVEVPNFPLGNGCLLLTVQGISETGTFSPVRGAVSVSDSGSNNLNISFIGGTITVKSVIAEYVKPL